MSAASVGQRSTAWAAYAASAWAFLFAAVSFYWAAGGRAGMGTLSRGIREQAEVGDAGFVALVWATGVLKVAAGLLALALAGEWSRSIPRWVLLVAAWGTGALLTLYGAMDVISAALAEFGVTEASDPASLRWYLFLWGPVWLLGGILFVAAAWHFTRATRKSDRRRERALSAESVGG